MIKAIIIGDTSARRIDMLMLLEKYCKDSVEVVATTRDLNSGSSLIEQLHPQLVFLNLDLEPGKEQELLQPFAEANYAVVFLTDFSLRIVQILRELAIDYLLQPFKARELEELVAKAKARFRLTQQLVLPTRSAYHVVDFDELVRVEADGSYSVFYMDNGRSFLTSHSLRYYESRLMPPQFFRIHKSHIINCHKVLSFESGRTGKVYLKDGSALSIAARRKGAFVRIMDRLMTGVPKQARNGR